MKRKIFTIIAGFAFALCCTAQTATEILDKTAKQLENSGGIEACFKATSLRGTTERTTTSGTFYVKEDKIKIISDDANIWFDGKTQWSLYANSDEVNVSNPTEEELQSINPYTFINFYKHGFDHTMSVTTYNGKSCYKVRMIPQNPLSIKEMRIVIDQKTFLPYSIQIQQNNDYFIISIKEIKTHNKWKDSFFRFNEKEFPNVEVIDLR